MSNHHNCGESAEEKAQRVRAVRDVMDLLNGKWKIVILCTLSFGGKKRFMELLREVDGIAAKMLSKELQELEMNRLITRTVCDTKPVTVEYEITPYGKTLDNAILEITNWGLEHRKTIMQQSAYLV